MNKFILIILAIFGLSFFSNAAEVKNCNHNYDNISFSKYFNTYKISKFTTSEDGENFLSSYKNLFLPLTIAFGVLFLVDLIAATVFSVTYGLSYNNNWWGSQPGLLAGTIATWSMFSFFGILTIISLVLFVMANPGSVPKTNKKAMIDIRPSTTNVSFDIIYKF
ncbi:MAG TPA: hypothetical protein PK771_14220 [Spirochaetota bacterium]|nr:hypothetical protein [Spirochaetota bacterium]